MVSKSKDLAGIFVFGSMSLGTLYLGTWQTRRYFWKVGEIEKSLKASTKPPVPLPVAEQSELAIFVNEHKGHKILLHGVFDHTREIKIGPRSAPPMLTGKAAQGMATNPTGYTIVTPFKLRNGNVVYIMRGWIPKSARSWERPTGEIDVLAIGSEAEKGNFFSPVTDPKSKELIWLDIAALKAMAPVTEDTSHIVLVEAVRENDDEAKTLPMPRQVRHLQTVAVPPEMHVAYAFTWFSLSLAGFIMTYLKFRRPLPNVRRILRVDVKQQ